MLLKMVKTNLSETRLNLTGKNNRAILRGTGFGRGICAPHVGRITAQPLFGKNKFECNKQTWPSIFVRSNVYL